MENKSRVNFVVFSDDWAVHPSSCQHIFKHIAKQHPVLWVNTIGMRSPNISFYDLKKTFYKLKKMLFGSQEVSGSKRENLNLKVVQPAMLPFLNFPGVNKFNRLSVRYSLNRELGKLKFERPVLVITAPNAVDYIDSFDVSKVVYYSVDDYSEWPGLNKGLVLQMEEDLIECSDEHIATSEELVNRIQKYGKDAEILTHGVDIQFFSELPDVVHPLLDKIPSPRVGYFGLFDKRSDIELLLDVSQSLPDVSFVITGVVEGDFSSLRRRKNVYFTGPVPYGELPAIAKGYDVCMLPYKLNRLTNAIQPLKFKEYIATGKPIISTPIKEALKLKNYILIAKNSDEWVELIECCLEGSFENSNANRNEFLQKESWEEKAKHFLTICLR